jgi:microcin C transport system substrate-binding protein
VDAILTQLTGARSKAELIPACRALERVIAHSHLLIPQWTAGAHRIAYSAWRLQPTAAMPPYSQGEGWAIDTWWARPGAPH